MELLVKLPDCYGSKDTIDMAVDLEPYPCDTCTFKNGCLKHTLDQYTQHMREQAEALW